MITCQLTEDGLHVNGHADGAVGLDAILDATSICGAVSVITQALAEYQGATTEATGQAAFKVPKPPVYSAAFDFALYTLRQLALRYPQFVTFAP